MGILKKLFLVAVVFSAGGCGLTQKFWGEKAPARETVTMQGDSLPSFQEIFSADDAESQRVLGLWRKSMTDTFNQIEGSKKDFLSTPEIVTLVKKGFVQISPDQNTSIERTKALLQILGYKDGISTQDVQTLFDWFQNNRVQARTFYRLFLSNDAINKDWSSGDLINLLRLFGSFIELNGNHSLTADQLNALIQPWLGSDYPHAKAGLRNGLEMSIAFFGSLCGDRVETDRWNGRQIGVCIHQLVDHFEPTAPVFDFIFGQLNPFANREKLAAANAQLTPLVKSWLDGHHHPAFATQTILDFSTALSIPPPYQFFRLMDWVPKLNADSTAKSFNPTFFISLATVMQNWVGTLLTENTTDPCTSDIWKSCAYSGHFDPVEKLYSDEYATLIRDRDMGLLSKLALDRSIAQFLMNALDTDHLGYLNNGIQQLITVATRLMDSNNFAYNVLHRIEEKSISDSNADAAVQNFQLSGLAEVVAFASELIPARTNHSDFNVKNITENVDELGLTTFLYLYDLLGNFRDDYLAHYDLPQLADGDNTLIKRTKFMETLPTLLAEHFPRTYDGCVKWGFERTCGIVFSEIIPTPDVRAEPLADSLEPYNLDLITITGILIESMISRCGVSDDGTIQNSACIIDISQALVTRLTNANIIHTDGKARTLIGLVKNVAFFTWAGKLALAKGTAKGLGLNILPPISLFSGPASVGSTLSLAAELMNEDKTAAVVGGTVGPHDKAGDELLYQNQLTLHFLPSHRR